MKTMITTDDGELIEVIENIEEIDMDSPYGRADFVANVTEAIARQSRVEKV